MSDSWFSWLFGEDDDEENTQREEQEGGDGDGDGEGGGEHQGQPTRVSRRYRTQHTRSRHHRKAVRKTIGRGSGSRRNQNKE